MIRAGHWFLLVLLAASGTACGQLSGCDQVPPDPNVVVPDSFVVALETSRGRVDIMAHKDWAPIGVGRLYELVRAGYYDEARFFRVIRNFVAQFGLAADPKLSDTWQARCLADEPVKHPNTRGTLTYARVGPATRSVQLFINLKDNPSLDTMDGYGFPPIAEVVTGMDVVDSLYSGYGDAAPRSGPQYMLEGPNQDSIFVQGNSYLSRGWPKLDYIKSARIARQWP